MLPRTWLARISIASGSAIELPATKMFPRTELRNAPSQQECRPVMVRLPPTLLSSASVKGGDCRSAKTPGNGGLQDSTPPPPITLTLPLIVLACSRTPSAWTALMLPNTLFWPVSVPPVLAFGSSVQVLKFGSQPMASSAPRPTLTSPFTVRLDVPVLATSLSANVAFRAEPGARIRSPLITAAPPLTAHTPLMMTSPLNFPARTPGDWNVPVQTLDRCPLAWAAPAAPAPRTTVPRTSDVTAARRTIFRMGPSRFRPLCPSQIMGREDQRDRPLFPRTLTLQLRGQQALNMSRLDRSSGRGFAPDP